MGYFQGIVPNFKYDEDNANRVQMLQGQLSLVRNSKEH